MGVRIDRKHKYSKESCENIEGCSLVNEERERSLESLSSHLSEQRHDFFNLLQLIYGYTQLKKPDKVLECITSHSSRMENIGRLYNCKCISLADLLYTKIKEAEGADIDFEIDIDINIDSAARVLDSKIVMDAVEQEISNLFFALESKGYKHCHVIFSLKENTENFHIEIYCREVGKEQLKSEDTFVLNVPKRIGE